MSRETEGWSFEKIERVNKLRNTRDAYKRTARALRAVADEPDVGTLPTVGDMIRALAVAMDGMAGITGTKASEEALKG